MNTAIYDLLNSAGALVTGAHFVYTSGGHGATYVNKDAIYARPELLTKLSFALTLATTLRPGTIDVVAGPVGGGAILAHWLAFHFGFIRKPNPAFAIVEKEASGCFFFRHTYAQLVHEKRVLLVDDILTTGASVRGMIEAVRRSGGTVAGIAVLCDRRSSAVRGFSDVPFVTSLFHLPLDDWDERECPLCAQGIPVNTDYGHGQAFLERNAEKTS